MEHAALAPRSRLHPTPRGRRIAITSRDLALFRLLGDYRYLPSNFLLAFLGGHPVYHKARMGDLFHEGWLQKPQQQWEAVNARYRFDCYELGRKAIGALAEEGIEVAARSRAGSFRHELMVSLLMALFALSARRHGFAVLSHKDVLLCAPDAVPKTSGLFSIPVVFSHRGESVSKVLRADGSPFGISGTRTFWLLGFEADRHTEPLHPADLMGRNSSILLKLLSYRALVTDRLFETRLGLPNLLVPFVTVNDTHLQNVMALMLKLTDGQGARWMLFRSLPQLASVERSVPPDIDLLATPWLRAGHPPLNLLEALHAD